MKKWRRNARKDAVRLSSQPRPEGVAVEAGLPYLPDGDPMHTLNLYRPEGAAGLLPTVVDIHGGGWMYGDRELNRNYCMALAAQGYAVMGMSYRLLPQVDLRGQVQDVFASLHWLEEHGAEHGFDLSRILLTGDSAGGHLAGLTACIQKSRALQALYGVQPPEARLHRPGHRPRGVRRVPLRLFAAAPGPGGDPGVPEAAFWAPVEAVPPLWPRQL